MASNTENSKEIEELFKQSMALNKKYLNQSFKIINQLGSQKRLDKNMFTFQPDVYGKAFSTFTKLSLDYYNNMMDFGFSVADSVLFDKNQTEQPDVAPSFTLNGSGVPGSKVKLQFVLENTKTEEVHCELRSTQFFNEEDENETEDISTQFKPQSFDQLPDEASPVEINLAIGKSVKPGSYTSHVKVLGFEPIFFAIILNVEQPNRQAKDVKTKKQGQKKG